MYTWHNCVPWQQGQFSNFKEGPRNIPERYMTADILTGEKITYSTPDSKVHGANMGPIWGRQDPGGPHVGPMNFAIWENSSVITNVNEYDFQQACTHGRNFVNLNVSIFTTIWHIVLISCPQCLIVFNVDVYPLPIMGYPGQAWIKLFMLT